MDFWVLFAALLPICVLIFYIYRKDSLAPEPAGQLLKAFVFGIISIFVSLLISIPLGALGLYPSEPVTVWGAVSISFFGAAIPEEAAKLFMLWLVLRKNKWFDEKMDGIVYAACVSLGFAALENVMYLFSNYENWLSVGITRALLSVPGHFCFGVLMGYYYSLMKFYPKSRKRNAVMAFVAPVIVHGIFDSLIFTIDVAPAISGILTVAFLFFCHRMWKYASRKIKDYLSEESILKNENCIVE